MKSKNWVKEQTFKISTPKGILRLLLAFPMWWERISTAKTNFSNNNYQQPTDRIEQSSAANVSREQSSCCKVYEFRIGKVNFVRQFWCCCAICNNADCTFNYNNNCNTWTDCSSRIQIAHTLTLNFLAERRLQWKKIFKQPPFWMSATTTNAATAERERAQRSNSSSRSSSSDVDVNVVSY